MRLMRNRVSVGLTVLAALSICHAAVACSITVNVASDYVAKSSAQADYVLLTLSVTGLTEGTITLASSDTGGEVRFRDEYYNIVTQLSVADIDKDFWVEGITESDAVGDVAVTATLEDTEGEAQDTDTDTVTVVAIKKIPLGGNANLTKFIIGKVYVPTKWGGNLKLSGNNVELFYTDGSDLDSNTAVKITKGELTSKRVAQGNPCTYTVPKDKFKWYYVKITALSPTAITATFEQSRTVTKSRWSCPLYDMSDELTPNLYGAGRCLEKYDTAYVSESLEREKRAYHFAGGHYVAKNTIRESDAERTVGYDFDNDDGDNDVWTGWDANRTKDFWNGTPPAGDWGTDGDTTDNVDASWWGHCDMATAVIICENEPTGNYNAPNSVVFTPALKKGLLVALYHKFTWHDWEGYDVKPHLWHERMEEEILGNDKMFACDTSNSGTGGDVVYNYPIFEITKAEYKEKPGQTDEKIVQVKCETKYWAGAAASLYYWYNFTYSTAGIADSSTGADWMDHPSAPANKKKPDSVWVPDIKTSVDAYWGGELDYDTIRKIVPAPSP